MVRSTFNVSLRQTAAVLNQKLGYLSVGFHYKFILTKVPREPWEATSVSYGCYSKLPWA